MSINNPGQTQNTTYQVHSILEREIADLKKSIQFIRDDETKSARNLKYFVTSAITLGVGMFALLGYFNFSVNSAQITDKLGFEIAKVESKLKELGDNGELRSVSTSSAYARKSFVFGIPSISRDLVDNLYVYTLKIEFQIGIRGSGDGTGTVVGVFRRYDGDYAKMMSPSTNEVYADSLINGSITYFDGAIVIPGYTRDITWSEAFQRNTCKEATDLLNSLQHDKNIGNVYVEPVFVKIKEKPDQSKFSITIGELNSLHNCESFK